MSDHKIKVPDVLVQLAEAMANQRAVLESSDFDLLEKTLSEAQAALDAVMAYPGGAEGVREGIQRLPERVRLEALELLERASLDHRVGRELVGVAMQRSAAVQAFQVSQSEGATYSQEGGVSTAAGSLLSRKA